MWDEYIFPPDIKRRLVRTLSGPDRSYHGIDHINALWESSLFDGGQLEGSVEMSILQLWIAYHDIVYHADRPGSEQESVEEFLRDAPSLPINSYVRDRICNAISATSRHPISANMPNVPYYIRYLCDLDLLGLSSDPDQFCANGVAIREEFKHLDDAQFIVGRIRFYRTMLGAPSIYTTRQYGGTYEQAARRNIQWAIEMLQRGEIL